MNLRTANFSGATLRLSCVALACLPLSGPALAHEGHGMEGSHWHATDIWGLLAVAAAAALYYHHRK